MKENKKYNIKLSPISRKKFAEGRDQGMGVAFAKRKGSVFYASQPLSACKDFLNDEIWSEVTGKEYSIYGQKSSKKDLFNDKNYAYMLLSFLPKNNGNETLNFEKNLKSFCESIPNVEKCLRRLDREFGAGKTTKIFKTSEKNIFLVKVPKIWASTSYAISLYTLVARNASNYTTGPINKYLLKADNLYSQDKYLVSTIATNYQDILQNTKHLFNSQSENFTMGGPHGKGIIDFHNTLKNNGFKNV